MRRDETDLPLHTSSTRQHANRILSRPNSIKTISIVECEEVGVKCSEYFFEPSLNDLAALSIGSINRTIIKFGGNRHIYE